MSGHIKHTPRVAGYAICFLMAALPALAQPNPDSSGPQTAVPTPAPQGRADVPGGSAQNGVIKPPVGTTSAMPVIRPPATGTTPVLRPPGSTGSQAPVQPK